MRALVVAVLAALASGEDDAAIACRPGECYFARHTEHAQQCTADVHCEAPAACNIEARRCQFEPIPSERVIRWAALIGGACVASTVLILGVGPTGPVGPRRPGSLQMPAIH